MTTIAADKIIKLLGETQLKYRRLHFEDYTRELAPRPATLSTRITLPSFFRTLFDEGANLAVQSVSGKKYSLWHCFLYAVYPKYIELSWYERKALVDGLIDELNHDVRRYFQKDPIILSTNMDPDDVRFHDQLPSDELVYYLSSKFQINIVICDTTRIYFYFPEQKFNRELPTIMFYRDDHPTFHVITVNDQVIAQDDYLMRGFYQTVPEVNRVLAEHTPMRKKDDDGKFVLNHQYAEVNNLTPAQTFELEVRPKLNGMRIDELQALAERYGLPIEKQGKTKMVKKLKKELVTDILAHHTSSSGAGSANGSHSN